MTKRRSIMAAPIDSVGGDENEGADFVFMDKEVLIAGGFVPTGYPGQEGEFLTKHTTVESLPYAGANLVNNDMIHGDSEAVTEVIPSGMVQLHIPDADYVEGPYEAGSEEAIALLKDALAAR